eukprot:1373610-Prymnesium_polylepis.1
MNTGDMFRAMWLTTIQMYPKLAIIDDDNYVHAILACPTESAQDDVLKRFLESKARSVVQEKSDVTPKKPQKN